MEISSWIEVWIDILVIGPNGRFAPPRRHQS